MGRERKVYAMRRRADRIDENQTDIVKQLRKVPGVTVEPGHEDILVGYKGITYWYEIKRPDQLKKDGTFKAGTIKPSQEKLQADWKGHYKVVTGAAEIFLDILAENNKPMPSP